MTDVNKLRLGSVTPSRYYLGDRRVVKMYLGSTLVYELFVARQMYDRIGLKFGLYVVTSPQLQFAPTTPPRPATGNDLRFANREERDAWTDQTAPSFFEFIYMRTLLRGLGRDDLMFSTLTETDASRVKLEFENYIFASPVFLDLTAGNPPTYNRLQLEFEWLGVTGTPAPATPIPILPSGSSWAGRNSQLQLSDNYTPANNKSVGLKLRYYVELPSIMLMLSTGTPRGPTALTLTFSHRTWEVF